MSRKSIGSAVTLVSSPRWFKAAAMIFAFIALVMLPRAAWAQRAKNDPHPEKSCVKKLSQTDVMYRVAFHPYCDLRELARVFPVLDEANKPLPMQVQLRNLYEANKDREVNGVKIRHTVMRGCVPNASPSVHADQEELQSCPKGLANYYAAPSGDSIAIIEVPRSRILSYTEKLEKLSQRACTALSGIANPDMDVQGVLESCRKMGIEMPAQSVSVVVDHRPSPATSQPLASNAVPPQDKLATKDARIAELEKQLAAPQTQSAGYKLFDLASTICLILAALVIILMALKLRRESKRAIAPIVATYDKKLADFKASYHVSNEELTLLCEKLQRQLDEARGEKASLEAKLQQQRSQATRPPAGQLASDNERLVKEAAELKSQKADLEFKVSASTGEAQASERRISALKVNLDTMTSERNQLQGICKSLEQERDQILQSLMVAESRALQARVRQVEAEIRGKDLHAESRISELQAQLNRVQSDAQAKDFNLTEARRELEKAEKDLADVGAANAELVREKQFLEDALSASRAYSAAKSDRGSSMEEPISTVKLAQDSLSRESTSTVKSVDSLSSTQNRNLTHEEAVPLAQPSDAQAEPQAISVSHVSDVSGIAQLVQGHLDAPPAQKGEHSTETQDGQQCLWSAETELKEYVSDVPPARAEMPTLSEQIINTRMVAILPPVSKDVTDAIPPRPSSPPPVDFATIPDEVLSSYFRNSLLEVGSRRANGMRNITFEVTGREDVYSAYEILNVPIVWALDNQEVQRELGSPKFLSDCQSPKCRRPQFTHTKTGALPSRHV